MLKPVVALTVAPCKTVDVVMLFAVLIVPKPEAMLPEVSAPVPVIFVKLPLCRSALTIALVLRRPAELLCTTPTAFRALRVVAPVTTSVPPTAVLPLAAVTVNLLVLTLRPPVTASVPPRLVAPVPTLKVLLPETLVGPVRLMPPVAPPFIVVLLAVLAVLPIVTVWVPVLLLELAMFTVEASVEDPTDPILTAPVVPPWILVLLVVLVEPMVSVCTAAPVAKLTVWAVAALKRLVAAVPDSRLKPVDWPLPILMVPVEFPALMLVLKLELSFRLTPAPVTVKPPASVDKPLPTLKVLLPVTLVVPFRLTCPEPVPKVPVPVCRKLPLD